MKSRSDYVVPAAILSTLGLLGCAVANAESPEALNDLEIAHVAYTAGRIDIRYAHLALALSENPDVRAFAETMLRDHTAVNDKAAALVQKLGLTPQDNFMSQQLLAQSNEIVAEMRALSGTDFDKRYAANELAYHQTVNGAVGGVFIPNAQNAELKALLNSALATFMAHEEHAGVMNRKVGN